MCEAGVATGSWGAQIPRGFSETTVEGNLFSTDENSIDSIDLDRRNTAL